MPPLLKVIMSINWDSRSIKIADWGLAAFSILIGILMHSWLWALSGVLGGIIAWWRPLGRVQRKVTTPFKPR